MRNNQPDELDQLLDDALASYSIQEPRPGLEQRVLSRVRSEGVPRRFGWWQWAVAIPVFASLLLLAIAHRPKPQATSGEGSLPSVEAPAMTDVTPSQPRHIAPRRARHAVNWRVAARDRLPKREVFPLPASLSPGERALVDLVTRFPDQAREVLIEANQRSDRPIEIPRIEIPPLAGGSE